MNIQNELQKIHHQYGTSEKANYEIQKLFDAKNQTLIKPPTPQEMAKERLAIERGGNMALWVDSEQTEYWCEIYEMGVSDERNRSNLT
jgi:hypothetical protein